MKKLRLIFFSVGFVLAIVFSINVNAQNNKIAVKNQPVYGKYGCTASVYRNGSYEFVPRGFLTITKDGKYTYNGFKNPSKGTYSVNEAGDLLFKGGYLNDGKAEKIDRPNKFFLVFPTIPDNRWTCGLITKS